MASSKYKLGQLLRLCEERNEELRYGIDDVKGISIQKEFIETKADMEGVSLKPYYIVMPGSFAYVTVTSRNGEKITLAYNASQSTYIVSSSYIVFKIERKDIVLAEYLLMHFKRPEFDRYSRFNSWGSARETFSWQDMCDIDIELPPLPIQQKYVDIYNAMQENQRCYERGLDDLKLTIDAMLDQYKHAAPRIAMGQLLQEVDQRNSDGQLKDVQGINIEKKFIPSVASLDGVDVKRYKLVEHKQFAYSSMQTGRDECIRIALNQDNSPVLVSPAYTVLQKKTPDILEEYIMMWFSRSESDRLGWFMSDASIRANLDLNRFYEIKIPLPSISAQKSLVDIYSVFTTRKEINERLKAQLKDLCPILIKGSVEEARKENPYGALHAASWNAQTH